MNTTVTLLAFFFIVELQNFFIAPHILASDCRWWCCQSTCTVPEPPGNTDNHLLQHTWVNNHTAPTGASLSHVSC